jgi:hypothetical protein
VSAWCRRAWLGAALAAAVLAVTGALATIHVRPYGHRAPRSVRAAMALTDGARAVHGAATVVLVLAGGGLALSLWRRRAVPGRTAVAVALLLLVALLATGALTPWQSLRPWSPPLGGNMARAVPLLGNDGPFPELTGANVSYDDTVVSIGSLRLGPRGVGRLYFLHALVLPAAGVALLLGLRRRLRRAANGRPPGLP